MRIPTILIAAMAALALGACGDDVQFRDPPTKDDPHAGHNHGPNLPSGHAPVKQGQKAGAIKTHGGEDDPFAEADVGEQKPTGDPKELVYSGTLTLPEGAILPDPCWVWVSAGHPPTATPPVLTKLYPSPTFPLAFELRRGDTAFPGAAVPAAADLMFKVSVGKNRFVEGIVLKFKPTTEAYAMGSKDLAITLKKP